MSTRSRIGLELPDGSILSAYAHWDGYPEWMGRILRTHYNSKDAAAELIDGGDMSSPWTNCGWRNETRPETGPMYYSERGEDCPPRLDADMDEFFSDNEEYSYIFRNGEWVCYNMNQYDDSKLPEIVEIPSGALMV